MKLEELNKFALALNQPGAVAGTSGKAAAGRRSSAGARKGKLGALVAQVRKRQGSTTNRARENATELVGLRSVDDLKIDHRRALNVKRGDLAIIQGEVYRCTPVATHLSEVPLVLKRLDCVDRRTYDLKVYEADTFVRFQGHANIVSLFSYWSEKAPNPYTYKSLVMLFEEGLLGDMKTSVVDSETRPSNRLALRYACDISKGLIAVHNCNFIHGRVKPSTIYLDQENTAMLGEFGKTELDAARQTHQLFSKLLIGDAIPHTLIYWAPELLRLEKYDKSVDMWALGVTLYEVYTGKHPFSTQNEQAFRDDALTANFDPAPLADNPRLATIIANLLKVDPSERWTAQQVLAYAQADFARDIQRAYRGYIERKEFQRKRRAMVMLQSHVKGWLTARRYARERAARKNNAATKIQSRYRTHRAETQYTTVRRAFIKCQANVVAKQTRRAYLEYRRRVIFCQSIVRRWLAMRWYERVNGQKTHLETKLKTIHAMILAHGDEVAVFQDQFKDKDIPPACRHLRTFEAYEKKMRDDTGAVALPDSEAAEADRASLEAERDALKSQLENREAEQAKAQSEEQALRATLGAKYDELAPMIDALKANLARVAKQVEESGTLVLKMQHPYSYSKWDQVHEPENVVENVLRDDAAVYRAVEPAFDFTVCSGSSAFLSEIQVSPGECGPAKMQVFVSDVIEQWTQVAEFPCTRAERQTFLLPGEQVCRYLRVKFIDNVRGGKIVSVRNLKVKGLKKT